MSLEPSSANFYATALDPARSVIVEACAGSGKTWLLASRMLRLLLEGVTPPELLAITFTNKAAREMEERLVSWCAHLAECDDQTATEFLLERAVPRERVAELLPRARGLYTRLLTAQPGLNVRTYHSWFGDLIARAPLFSPYAHDSTLDEAGDELHAEAWRRAGARWVLWTDAQELEPDAGPSRTPQTLAFRELCALVGVHKAEKLVNACLAKRVEWQAFTEHCTSPEEAQTFALQELADALEIDPNEAPQDALNRDTALLAQLRGYIELVQDRSDTWAATAGALGELVLQVEEGAPAAAWWDELRLIFLRKDGEARVFKRSAAQDKKRGAERESAAETLHFTLAGRMWEIEAAIAAHAQWELNRLVLSVAQDVLYELEQLKGLRNVHDFADLEWRAWTLVAYDESAAYVQARLDARYRHLLLDEFQDTNPLQWKILQNWLSAYGADTAKPSVFLVGDPKQAIYRFRRADARVFDAARSLLEADFGAVTLIQQHTRRNAQAVVDVVNQVFEPLEASGEFAHFVAHTTARSSEPGEVIVLPLAVATADGETSTIDGASPAEPQTLRQPLSMPAPDQAPSLHVDEASGVAEKIKALVDRHTLDHAAPGGPRATQYRDVLVLVRSRTHVHHLEAALAARDVPVISARRGGLTSTLEAQDLQALLGFLIAPFNNLALAHALKSPLFGAADDDLVALASAALKGEPDVQDWWPCLQALAAPSAALLRARQLLGEWLGLTGLLPTHDLLDRIYHQADAINAYRASVPPWRAAQVQANLEAFIALSLEVESGRYASVPRFIERLKRYASDANSAPDEGEDTRENAVRVMTIHAAKGLEAPIVFLVGANSQHKPAEYADVLVEWLPKEPRPTRFVAFDTKPKAGIAATWFAREEELAARENLNLLYVAMTRARDLLVLSGVARKKAAGTSWYARVAEVVAETSDSGPDELAPLSEAAADELPALAGSAGRAVAATNKPAATPIGSRSNFQTTAATRAGEALHAALDIASRGKPIVLLQASPRGLAKPEIELAWRRAHEIITAPALSLFFTDANIVQAHNEVELVAHGKLLRIDRLVHTTETIWVLDYKLRLTLASAAAYAAQIEQYAAAVALLYAQKTVRAALIDCTACTYQEIAVV